ncbi:META superfamily protein [Psychroflexus torquis ATCC 700755]|uniref:META superfamily protein n=1 Tax=Psychroflexus torquis (strain ATCC 700755 / CIP 106069 / ACAM 623) TaxID=313595 RepID=K4ICD6_PSYTT|nr:META domain-containing protein [Psychroflexus torquis]AFU68079.1 META superfamily protein [Psychroflexus torquis ATCC 700755]
MKSYSILKTGFALFSIFLILVSCKAQQQGKMNSEKLIGEDYVITQLGDQELVDSRLTLKVDPENSKISGYSGCNNYNFSYKMNDGILDLGFASATKMYCDDKMDLENLFFQKAASVTQFDTSSEVIYLKSKEGNVLIKAEKKLEKSE